MNILSIGFHSGALDAIESMIDGAHDVHSELLAIDPSGYHYNMTQERASCLWDEHKDFYNGFDVIITSDTAPLSRIFLQGGYAGKVMVYVCNRVDYYDGPGDGFPDDAYYKMLRSAMGNPNVSLIGYTPYEQVYCNRLGVYLEDIIKPCFKANGGIFTSHHGYYIPTYQNNYNFDLKVKAGGLNVLSGRHDGIDHLATFKAVIHLPYHWNGIANSEALSVGVPYYVPSKRFLLELSKENGYWFQNVGDLEKWIDICDFYDKRYKDWLFYFDSWQDIHDIEPDYNLIRDLACRVYYENRRKLLNILDRWK